MGCRRMRPVERRSCDTRLGELVREFLDPLIDFRVLLPKAKVTRGDARYNSMRNHLLDPLAGGNFCHAVMFGAYDQHGNGYRRKRGLFVEFEHRQIAAGDDGGPSRGGEPCSVIYLSPGLSSREAGKP